ncbi:MAG: GNAT family N-acetyltransferase [Chitinophagales bacterium]
MKQKTIIRFAEPKDINELVLLCEAHAIYEKATYETKGKAELLKEYIFATDSSVFCLVAENNNKLIGYATYMKQFSTWDCCFYVYMDCLFLGENSRSKGIGEQIMNRIKEETAKMNIEWIQWQTPDFNTRAIKFYKRIGASAKTKKRFFLKSK